MRARRIIGKVARVAGMVVAALVALALVAVGAAWTFAQTDRGGDFIRRLALKKVNAQIAGELALERFEFGGNRVVLDGVVLRDPQGATVAQIDRIDLRFSPLALIHRHVDIRSLEIARPQLSLVADENGSNLARALAPAHPAPEKKKEPPPTGASSQPPGITVDLQTLALHDGSVSVRSAAPAIRVTGLGIDGGAHFDGPAQALTTHLAITMDGGRIDADGTLDLAKLRPAASGFTARVRGIDLAKLMRDTPTSDIAVNVEGHGDVLSSDLLVRAPGLTVNGHGGLDGDKIDAKVHVEATDLDALAHSLARCHLAPPLDLSGSGRVDLAAGGTTAHPTIKATARVPRLRFQDNAVRDLNLSADLPRLDAPGEIRLDLSVAEGRVGGQKLRAVAVTAHAIGPSVQINVKTAKPYPLSLAADGYRLSPRTVRLDHLALKYPEAAWTLARSVTFSFGDDRLALGHLDLRGTGGQSIRAELTKTGDAGHAQLTIVHFDLGRLPRAFVPATVTRAGKVDLDLDLHFSPARLRGRLAVAAIGTRLDGTFDLPASFPPKDTREPAKLALKTSDTDLATLAKLAGAITGHPVALDPRGHVRLTVALDGSVATPRLQVALGARGLALAGRTIGDLDLTVRGDDQRPITAKLTTSGTTLGPKAKALVIAQTALTMRELVRKPPTSATVERTPVTVHVDLESIPLDLLAKLANYPTAIHGTLSAAVDAHGTVADPVGKVAIDLASVATSHVPPTDARIELTLAHRATQANVRVTRLQHPLLALTARVEAGLAALQDQSRLQAAPLQVRAVVGPITIKRRGLPGTGVSDEELGTAIHGTLHADLSVDGTLRAPRLDAHLQADDLTLDEKPIGAARVEARYAAGHAHLDTDVSSANGGSLTVRGHADADLGLPAIRRDGLDPARLPFDVTVEAKQLDLRGFSGITENVRKVAGLLDAEIKAHGTAGEPQVDGRLECKDCEVQVAGVGDFQKIHLALHGDAQKITLDELAAKAGDGHLRLTGDVARRTGKPGYDLTMKIAATDIPAYQEGQPLATVSLDAGVNGSLGQKAHATVSVNEARVVLSDAKRKELQSLAPAKDVVLVDDGKPIDRKQAKKLKEVDARLKLLGQPISATPAVATAPEKPSAAEALSDLRVTVEAPRKLWVTGNGARLELGLAPGFRIELGSEVQIFGQVMVLRGRIDALGRRFDLKSDTNLQFDGPPGFPTLDATAQYVEQTQNVIVLLTAKGAIDHLKIGVSSPNHPEYNDSQLYSIIITGHAPNDGSSGGGGAGAAAAGEASAFLAGEIAAGLQKTLAKHLPLDVLTIDAGSGQGLTGTQLEAGRYVTDKLYVGYIGRIGADPNLYQNRNAVHVEYELGARWQIAGEYGDVGTGSADLIWKKNY